VLNKGCSEKIRGEEMKFKVKILDVAIFRPQILGVTFEL
jgi:hypothetical protein